MRKDGGREAEEGGRSGKAAWGQTGKHTEKQRDRNGGSQRDKSETRVRVDRTEELPWRANWQPTRFQRPMLCR